MQKQQPLLDDADRKAALQRTADVMRECNQIRQNLELPPEALSRILDVYLLATREISAEKEQASWEARTFLRVPMTMSSPEPIKRGDPVAVTARPQGLLYRIEEIEILGDPTHWLVHDLRVGWVSQSPHVLVPPIPGDRFRKGGIMSEIRLDGCQTAMDFVLVVEYVGPLDEGAVFEAVLVGTSIPR